MTRALKLRENQDYRGMHHSTTITTVYILQASTKSCLGTKQNTHTHTHTQKERKRSAGRRNYEVGLGVGRHGRKNVEGGGEEAEQLFSDQSCLRLQPTIKSLTNKLLNKAEVFRFFLSAKPKSTSHRYCCWLSHGK